MHNKTYLHILGLVFLLQSAYAQISGVNYQLRFNEQTNFYDCYLVITDGATKTVNDRIQFNAQYTLVVPTGSSAKIVKSYMPLQENRDFEGSIPVTWSMSNLTQSPKANPYKDYMSIVPSLTPTGFYNDLKAGDEIKLFSVNIQPVTNCGADVKIFENGKDLSSAAKGMSGGDYSNGFTMGGVAQIHMGNAEQIIPELSVIESLAFTTSKTRSKISAELNENSKFGPYTYEWTGPQEFYSNNKEISIDHKNNALISGKYTMVVTDDRGCKQSKSIDVDLPVQHTNTSILASNANQNLVETRDYVRENINIYPNPANNYFTLAVEARFGTKLEVDIIDMDGKTIQSNVVNTVLSNGNFESKIDIQNFSPGIYNVAIKLDDKINTQRLIVIK